MAEGNERPLRLLLVDDSDDDALMLRLALKGNQRMRLVDHLEDGDLLIDYLQRQSEGFPDLVLLDINMPRMNGLQVLRELKEHPDWRGLPVVMLSTSTLEQDIRSAYFLGASSFVSKPEDTRGFRELVAGLGAYWVNLAKVPGSLFATGN